MEVQSVMGAEGPLVWFAQTWCFMFLWDFGRYFIGAGGVFLLVWLVFSGLLKARKIRPKGVPAKQMRAEFRASVVTAAIFALSGTLIQLGVQGGIYDVYTDIADRGWGYFFLSLGILIVLHDAYFYWAHRFMHIPAVMRRMHWLHHRSMNPSPWAAYSFDVPEAVAHAIFTPIVLLFMPLHPLVMFLFLGHMMLRNAIGHAGYELFPRRMALHPVFGQMTTVTHHDMHHSNGRYNFGLYFSWWDRLMGTENPRYLETVTGDAGARCGGQQTLGAEG